MARANRETPSSGPQGNAGPAGLEFLKDFHFDMGGFGFHSQPVCDYREYNPIEKLSRQWYKNLFTPRLRDALTFLGLNPKL